MLKVKCKVCGTDVAGNQSRAVSCGCENMTTVKGDVITAKDLSKVMILENKISEAKKAYERVVDHLVSEGYARTKTDADNIIGGMSEEWYHMIIDS